MQLTGFQGTERFDVIRRLGAGGMGVVYEALDRESNQRVALKTLRTSNANALLRFKNEFRSLAHLAHPNLVNLGELFEVDGRLFFTMELIRGVDFVRYVRLQPDVPTANARRDPQGSERPGAFEPVAELPWEMSSTDSTRTTDRIALGSGPVVLPPGKGGHDDNRAGDRYPDGDRSGVSFNEVRLRAATVQLAEGVQALHSAGKVHRDIKPSNIMVTGDGRVVLLDFGLVSDVGRDTITERNRLIGTVRYMAPEQARQADVGAAADWYSVGVVLYLALTGATPFDGSGPDMLRAKTRLEPTPPAEYRAGVPRDLSDLCTELLRIDPAMRPSGDQVLARLWGVTDSSVVTGSGPHASAGPVGFVGRERELSALRQQLSRVRRNAPVVCLLSGQSGVGKTSVVRQFARLVRKESDPVVLAGRCYQRESVPYKAVDELVDTLAGYLCSLSDAFVETLIPRRTALLTQLFPVLRRVPALADQPQQNADTLPGYRHRSLAFAALRQLLANLAEQRPLILIIDDLQWTDRDSLALLGQLLHPPNAPGLLLIATVRSLSGAAQGRWDMNALRSAFPCEVHDLEITCLPPGDARELVARLTSASSGHIDVDTLVDESRGHPLFLDVLVRHRLAAGSSGTTPQVMSLDEAIRWHIRRLGPIEADILELLCIAGRPLSRQAVASIITVDPQGFDRRIAALIGARLAISTGNRASDLIDAFHTRIREAVLAHLDAEPRRHLHRRLALALEHQVDTDPEFLAAHWRAAGDDTRAVTFYENAARKASQSLAFDRATRLYRICLEVDPASLPGRPENRRSVRLGIALADALVNAGRGAEAAREYLAASQAVEAIETPGTQGSFHALELQRQAAEQFIRSGYLAEGMAALDRVLSAVGFTVPPSPRRAIMRLALRRAWLRLRGRRYRQRSEDELSPWQRVRLDTCWVAAASLSLVNPVCGALFQARHLALALAAGEPQRVARAIAVEAAYATNPGGFGRERTNRLLAEARHLAEQTGDPKAVAWATAAEGVAAYLFGEWRQAMVTCREAEQLMLALPRGTRFEVATMRQFHLASAYMLGDVRTVQDTLPAHITEAEERDDLYAAIGLRSGHLNAAWLALDEPDRARAYARQARQWIPTEEGAFHVQHYYDLLAQTHIDLYHGDGRSAHHRVESAWPLFTRSLLTRVQQVRIFANHLRARANLALAAAGHHAGTHSRALHIARRCAGKLERERMPWARAMAASIRASAAFLHRDRKASDRYLALAIDDFERAEMAMYAHAARRCRGAILDPARGHSEIAAADRWMTEHGIHAPGRFARILIPGFDRPAR